MAQLVLDAINPVLDRSWGSWLWTAFGIARWDLTCGLCRTRFWDTGRYVRGSVVCPACGTRNRLPTAGPRRRAS